MGRSLLDIATTFTVSASDLLKPEAPSRWEGRLEPLPAAAVQPLAECPMQIFKRSKHWCSLPRFPCCCWAAVPGMGLNRTISSLLCFLAPSRRADIWREKGLGDNIVSHFPGEALRSLRGLPACGVIQVLMLLISHAFRIKKNEVQRNK